MGPIFGKRNYRQTFEMYLKENNFNAALSEAIKLGDEFYTLQGYDSAIEVFNTLIKLFEEKRIDQPYIMEKLLEKIIPLYFEKQDHQKALEEAYKLVNIKIRLKKVNEVVQLLKILEKTFSNNRSVLRNIVNIYVSIKHYQDALNIIEKLVKYDSKNVELCKIAGDLLYKLGRFDDSLSYYTVVSILDKKDEEAISRIHEIEEILGKKAQEKESASETLEKISPVQPEPVIEEKEPEEIKIQEPESPPVLPKEAFNVPKDAYEEIEPSFVEKGEKLPLGIKKAIYSEVTESVTKAPEYIKALEEIKNGNLQVGIWILENLAATLEKNDFRSAELLYSKILLLEPENYEIAKKLSELYKENKMVEESIFYLRIASRNAKGKEKISLLKEVLKFSPQDEKIREELFEEIIKEKKFEEAYDIIKSLGTNEEINEYSGKLFPHAKDNFEFISKISNFLSSRGIKSEVSQQYFYSLAKSLFASENKHESIKWFLAAHRISKLSLEDYVELAKFIFDLPLEEEKEIVTNAIYSYVDSITSLEEKLSLINMILMLNPDKMQYIAKRIEINLALGKNGEIPRDIMLIVKRNAIENADLVYRSVLNVIDLFDIKDLVLISEYLEIAGRSDLAENINLIILEKEPQNEIAIIKSFIKSVENESIDGIIKFFDKTAPSYSYMGIIAPVMQKAKEMQLSDPFDYKSYFLSGFLYFLAERYEEAIAAFQFVVRSKHHEPLMYLFLAISFDKIKLPDFAERQIQFALKHPNLSGELKKEVLYRAAILKKTLRKTSEFKKLITELIEIDPNFKNASELLEEKPEN